MDIVQIGANLLKDKLGVNVDVETIQSALQGLLSGVDGKVNLATLASTMMQNADLSAIASSWLGDGANAGISADKVQALLGQANIADFASKLGIGTEKASEGLADVLPQVMDKASSGGSLLDSVGGVDGLLGAAKSFFK